MRVQASGLSTSHVLSESDERRIEELFRKLDVNRDGRIDIHDLSEALHRLEVHQLPGHAQVFFGTRYDTMGIGLSSLIAQFCDNKCIFSSTLVW